MAQLSLLDIAKLNSSDAVVGLIEESLKAAPEMAVFPARTIKGTSYKTVIRTGLPTAGFRQVGAAITASKSSFTNKTVEAFSLGALLNVPKDVAKAYEDGVDRLKAIEAAGVIEAALRAVGKQVWYGTDATHGNANGFPGALQTYDSTNMVVDAGGTTATTGSSAWLVKFGDQHCKIVVGLNGDIELSDWREETVSSVPNYVADLIGYVGCQFVNINGICRIKKLTADSGKGLTDALIAEALSKFPTGTVPDAIFCSRRSRMELQKSRTVVLNGPTKQADGMSIIAEVPTDSMDIPIHVTDQIADTEALTL